MDNRTIDSELESAASANVENDSPEAAAKLEESTPESARPEEKSWKDSEREYQERIMELEDRYLRLVAEFDNYKKRTARQFEDIIKTANENLIVQLLDVADNFHRALEASINSSDFDALQKGTVLIYQHLENILKKEGLERIAALGEKFDPQVHDAMMQIETDDYPDGVVAMEISPGYRLKGKIIRHSKVAVSKGKSASEDDAGE